MRQPEWVAPACPMCGKPDAARMGNTKWEHNASCCSDACGYAYRDSRQRLEREAELARTRFEQAKYALREAESALWRWKPRPAPSESTPKGEK